MQESFRIFRDNCIKKMETFKANNEEKIKETLAYADEVFEKHNLQDWMFGYTSLYDEGSSYDIDYEEKTLLFDCGICGELNIAGINSSIEYYMEEIVAHLKAIETQGEKVTIDHCNDDRSDYDYTNLPF